MHNKSTLYTLTALLLLTLSKAYAEPFKVGVILPLSGPVAEYGDACSNGISLFKKDQSANNLSFIIEDSRYDGPTSISAFNKLVEIDKADLVFIWGAATSEILIPIAETRKVPTLNITGGQEAIKNKNYSIAFTTEENEFASKQLEDLRARGLSKIAIVKTDLQYFENMIKSFKDKLSANESIEVIESFPPGENTNFQPALTKIKLAVKKNKYDVLGVLLINGQLNSFYKKLNQQNLKLTTFGSDVFGSSFERKQSGSSMIGARWATLGTTNEFWKTYSKEFNKDDHIGYAANAYDLGSLLNDLFSEDYKNNKKLTPEEILNRIESIKERDGVSGKYYFTRVNPEADPIGGKRFKFPIVIKEVTEGGGERVIR